MNLERVPKHVPKEMLPGLKVGALVKTRDPNVSQDKNFALKNLPAGSVGRVKSIYDFGRYAKRNRFLCYIKFYGHPITNFYTQELVKVRI